MDNRYRGGLGVLECVCVPAVVLITKTGHVDSQQVIVYCGLASLEAQPAVSLVFIFNLKDDVIVLFGVLFGVMGSIKVNPYMSVGGVTKYNQGE